MTQPRAGVPGDERPTITVCHRGPLLVRGNIVLVDDGGNELAVRGDVVALCRCGRSSIAPHCDGSHKLPRRSAVPAEETIQS